ncbi:hypothetical protein RGQ30_00220 [Limnobacter thiooxidans]|uniref:Uncharacterized protein n=1 Tax=Limnobacter thiooxidans TaxID=131080 RepID=A0AA86MC78_9BURK|nr:hypothetical protein RGQ30_00220 [Limnobacter thiooxidans]
MPYLRIFKEATMLIPESTGNFRRYGMNLENAPSKTGNPSGGGRGNNPPGKK